MEKIKTENAEGLILCHDMTQIIKDTFKGPRFKKGHRVTKEDIPVLLSMGKEYLYVWDDDPNVVHENDGAALLYDLSAGPGMHPSDVKEGKIEAVADCDGLFKVDTEKLNALNRLGDVMIAARHGNFPVRSGDTLAGMRVIPLAISADKAAQIRALGEGSPIFEILPYKLKKAAVITTGSEVYKRRIEDKFTPVVLEKLAEYGVDVIGTAVCDDDQQMIADTIHDFIRGGAELVLCTGGMSVDPDDRTPGAIKVSGADVVSYGAPVLPGAMFLLAYCKGVPVVGLPGCVMYARRTVFDLVLPRLLAAERISADDLNTLGEGGLCLNCETCVYPNCGFGK